MEYLEELATDYQNGKTDNLKALRFLLPQFETRNKNVHIEIYRSRLERLRHIVGI